MQGTQGRKRPASGGETSSENEQRRQRLVDDIISLFRRLEIAERERPRAEIQYHAASGLVADFKMTAKREKEQHRDVPYGLKEGLKTARSALRKAEGMLKRIVSEVRDPGPLFAAMETHSPAEGQA